MHAEKMAEVRPNLFISSFKCLQTALCSSGYHKTIFKVKQAIFLDCLFLKRNLLGILPTGYEKMSGISSSSWLVEGVRL